MTEFTQEVIKANFPEHLHESKELLEHMTDNEIKVFLKSDSSKHDVIKYFLKTKKTNEAFFVVDLAELVNQYNLWAKYLPRIRPYYAVKCCPDPIMVKILGLLGCGYDCASEGEIELVTSQGISPNNIIYANAVKDPLYIECARDKGVNLMTFDNYQELDKIKKHHPKTKLIIRLKPDDSHSVFKFSTKFGCTLNDSRNLLAHAKQLDLEVVGVSFHVGSKCQDTETWTKTLKDAREMFSIGIEAGHRMHILDIGGGYPSSFDDSPVTFEEMAEAINTGIDTNFADIEDLKIMSEPGRFFAEKSHILMFNCIGKREAIDDDTGEVRPQYYMNDGMYGSFNCIFYDHAHPHIKPFDRAGEKLKKSTIFGPTCDSLDTITKDALLPELEIGDWMYVEDFGAYTIAASSQFNGFPIPKCNYFFLH